MKRSEKTPKKVGKGMPSAVLLSILIHAGLFLLAGMLVVFTVVKKPEQKFEPPKAVERPKMKLRKPKVKVAKSKPKSTTRIVTRANRTSMPDIQLPEMSGMGDGLGDGLGDGFDMMPSLEDMTLFGEVQSIGNDFSGTFYDLKRARNGASRPVADAFSIAEPLRKFVQSGWNPNTLSKFYRSPRTLYATSFIVPRFPADIAPEAFGEKDTGGWGWAVHYKGKLVHKDGITFRFWGAGDSVLMLRVDGKIALDGNYERFNDNYSLSGWTKWTSHSPDSNKYWYENTRASVSDWITLEPGVPLDMEILLGDVKGYGVSFVLCVEEEGVEYPSNKRQPGAPILPIFKTADPSRARQDQIHAFLIRDELSTTSGPIFNDFQSGGHVIDLSPKPILENQPEPQVFEPLLRIWTTDTGETIEAKYMTLVGGKVVLKSAKGKQSKILLTQLCAQDVEYVELAKEPNFNVSFSTQSKQKPVVRTSPYTLGKSNWVPPHIMTWTFGAKIKQTSAGSYNHELKVEYFAIGTQANDDQKFILLDRVESSFVPTEENNRSHQFKGDPCELQLSVDKDPNLGRKYAGNLVVVTDKRGKIIAHSASSKWLLDHLEALRVLPVNAYFDKAGRRVLPSNTKAQRY